MRGTLPTLLTTLLLLVPVVASAQVYKWKDANGIQHFSDSPPLKGVKYENIHTRIDDNQPRTQSNAGTDSDKTADATKNTKSGAHSAKLKRFCAQLKSNIALLKSKQPLQRMNSDGNNNAVTNKVRAQQLQQQQQRYQAYCSK